MTSSNAMPTAPLFDALSRLARGTPASLAALLHTVESHTTVDGTRVTAHCHCLKLDGNGRPRMADLVAVVAEHVLDYAIPRREIQEAQDEFKRLGSTQKLVRLHNTARGLFTDIEQTGEGGELLLFALAEKVLKLPQLLCKMSLKTNSRMHIHGADGLHAGADAATGRLVLYWGESKIYSDVTAAVRECLASVAPMLTKSFAAERELQLLQRHADLADDALEAALKKFLDPDAEEFNSLEFRGLCLVGFDCDAYPAPTTSAQLQAVTDAIATALPGWKSHLAKRVAHEQLEALAMHFILVPFPSADEFRQQLLSSLGLSATKKVDTAATAKGTKKKAVRKKTSGAGSRGKSDGSR